MSHASNVVYVVAVSGGVDSMVLLHAMHATKQPNTHLVVAHFDHGIRPESAHDAAFVQGVAARLGLTFETERVELGSSASEAAARDVRYAFLRRIKNAYNANAIITAHHQDDVLETMLLHVQRGTGRHGLAPMHAPDVLRPLRHTSKTQLVRTANASGIAWREDATNASPKYARNLLRQKMQQAQPHVRQQLVRLHAASQQRNAEMNQLLLEIYDWVSVQNRLQRSRFVVLPFAVQCELVHFWLRQSGVHAFEKATVVRLVIAIKTARIGAQIPIKKGRVLCIGKNVVEIL